MTGFTADCQAIQLSYLIDGPIFAEAKQGRRFHTVRFALHIEPLNTNWIALSQFDALQELETESAIGSLEPGNLGIDDYAMITVTDPLGNQSPVYTIDQNDENQVSYGPQSMVYGYDDTTPRVVRTDPAGTASYFNEGGVATPFFEQGGIGYYTFELVFMNEHGQSAGHKGVYIIMDVLDEYRRKPPIFINPSSQISYYVQSRAAYSGGGPLGLGSPFFSVNHGGDDGSNPPFIPNPGNPNLPVPENPFPTLPDGPDNPDPIIPEPLTLGLTGTGLAVMAVLRRRRRRD
jgi:hypothetical protein